MRPWPMSPRRPKAASCGCGYRDGEKTIIVPPGTPIVSFKPGDRSLLVPGAGVAVTVREIEGKPTALRISAGRNGTNPN
jgi:hypothetical protein